MGNIHPEKGEAMMQKKVGKMEEPWKPPFVNFFGEHKKRNQLCVKNV